MKYQIDQSGKIEHTGQVTVVAIANGKVKSVFIGAGEKQKLIKKMRILDHPHKSYVLKIFAAMIFLLLKDEMVTSVEIDKEYPGHEALIRQIVRQLFQKFKLKPPEIDFALVGKDSLAHKTAIDTFDKLLKPTMKTNEEELIQILYKKSVGAPDRVGKTSS